jgi:7-carboxy-7-deazaguanine synthase
LPCSGEPFERAIQPEVVHQYQLYGQVYLKFVVATDEDVADAERAVAEYRKHNINCPVYLMPVGGVPQVYNLNTQQVAKLALDRGWRYSPRLQVDIWRNAWGT